MEEVSLSTSRTATMTFRFTRTTRLSRRNENRGDDGKWKRIRFGSCRNLLRPTVQSLVEILSTLLVPVELCHKDENQKIPK
jgi:hypothetical protein